MICLHLRSQPFCCSSRALLYLWSLACSSSIMVPSKQNPSPRKVFGKRFLPDRWNMNISSHWAWSVFFLWFFVLYFHLLIQCLSPATRTGAKLSGFNKWLSFETGGRVAVGYISLTRAEEFNVWFRWDESQLLSFMFFRDLTWTTCWVFNGNSEGSSPKLDMYYPNQPSFRWWFQMFFIFTPTWGNDPILTNVFQMGWSHKLDPVSALFSQRLGVSFWLSMERWVSHVILFCSLKRIPHAVHVYVHTGTIYLYIYICRLIFTYI